MESDIFSLEQVADILGVSKATLRRWDTNGKLTARRDLRSGYRVYDRIQLEGFEEVQSLFYSEWDEEHLTTSIRPYTLIELFAGAGGLAIGMENAGFKSVMLNEIDKHACRTLKYNRPNWNVIEGDISQIDFSSFRNKIDVVSGGFPCQAFSYAGNKLGFEDTRGTLFFEFARAIKEVNPKILIAENVRGLLNHENGATLSVISDVIKELGYNLVCPKVLKAMFYKVPQKRERLFLVAIRTDLENSFSFKWPSPYNRVLTMSDALKKGILYDSDVPKSVGQKYPDKKKAILSMVPQGGYWKDLPVDIQREYMQKSYYLGGGKTGMARRLSWDEPSLTLTCAPAQKQTERCHPEETRPLTIREYARIQTFPDSWQFSGPISSQYKQIGNAVPVNLGEAVGRSVIRALNTLEVNESTRAQTINVC